MNISSLPLTTTRSPFFPFFVKTSVDAVDSTACMMKNPTTHTNPDND